MIVSEDDDFVPISALQHLVFCERQVALIHVLGRWIENAHTTLGRLVHERVDSGELTNRPGVQVLRNVALRSDKLRLRGFADVVEVHTSGPKFVPIEYKKGARKRADSDDIQLAAQAMALEEMTGTTIDEAVIFMAKVKRRRIVRIDTGLRSRVNAAASRVHSLISNREVPTAHLDARCQQCSLREECGPDIDVSVGTLAARLKRSIS